ncbi:hypothetical protein VNO77_42131 [Canavalia gladiata]|uniref:Uncharacterized protein n=1 Tax=Canavalia gladiata TaxID=3824 RepID=A0AAN9K045_CANGL
MGLEPGVLGSGWDSNSGTAGQQRPSQPLGQAPGKEPLLVSDESSIRVGRDIKRLLHARQDDVGLCMQAIYVRLGACGILGFVFYQLQFYGIL